MALPAQLSALPNPRHLRHIPPPEAAFRRDLLKHLPPVLLKRALRLVVAHLGGKLDHALTEQLVSRVLLEPKGSITSDEGQVALSWTEDRLHVRQTKPVPTFKEVLRTPGDTLCDPYNWRISVALTDYRNQAQVRTGLSIRADIDAFRGPLHFRSAQPGDRLTPFGATGNRKLSDLMGEARLTLLARKRLPIICDIIGPIWAPGVALAERLRVSPGSQKALSMVFAPISNRLGETETLEDV